MSQTLSEKFDNHREEQRDGQRREGTSKGEQGRSQGRMEAKLETQTVEQGAQVGKPESKGAPPKGNQEYHKGQIHWMIKREGEKLHHRIKRNIDNPVVGSSQ